MRASCSRRAIRKLTKRYPVIYFLHGLPANAAAYRGNDWLIHELERAGPAILVIPQGARVGDRDPEYLNWGAGRNWETYVSTEVPRYVDAHFRTIRSRRSCDGRPLRRRLRGDDLGLHHLAEFSVIESWSGYFHPTDPTGNVSLPREPARRRATSSATSAATSSGDRRSSASTSAGATRDSAATTCSFDAELTAAHVAHTFGLYRGAHTTRSGRPTGRPGSASRCGTSRRR